MHWADKLADQIIKSKKYKPYWVDDMKTPSGRVHIGSVRAFLTHAFVYMALKDRNVDVHFSYVLEDHDPFDKLPVYIDQQKFEKYLGMPLYKVPSPEPGFDSYGRRWGIEYMGIFKHLGVDVDVIWGSELYLSGKMNDVVKECLDKADVIKSIYLELYDQKKPSDWLPVNMVCEKCGKLSTTVAYQWDGEKVHYRCENNKVDWTQGCGFEGARSPFDGNCKMPWKVEWAAKWKAVGITVEGAGKDHMSDGGSHDFAKLMCEKVLEYPVPFGFSHEHFLSGGKKMSSSKGVGVSALEFTKILPAYLIRFLVARTKYNVAVDLKIEGMMIPDLFDGFDEAAKMFWDKPDDDLARVFELSVVNDDYKEKLFLPRFRDVAKVLQDPKTEVYSYFGELKGANLTETEKKVLDERVVFAKIWLDKYAPDDFVVRLNKEIPVEYESLSDDQKAYLLKVSELVNSDVSDPDSLQENIYNLSKEMGLQAKLAFQALYIVLISKTHGPKVAWLIFDNLDAVRRLLKKL